VKTVERLFTGRFPGVSVTQASNGGLQIRIRGGANSFMAGEEPLYLVDGSPLPQGTGGIVFLNPYDIETIEVLKNPADTGLYGVRGANGVIRITTLRPGRR
jgi:TonB-dependent SusC/RagA subfamily outer membrane receptor